MSDEATIPASVSSIPSASPAPVPMPGVAVASHPKQQGPLMKMMGKMLHLKTPKMGIKVNSSVHFGHGRKRGKKDGPKFY